MAPSWLNRWWAPYDAQSPHSLYSLSKSFTSTAVGLAIAEGKLSLDDEVLKFFPDDAPADPSSNLKSMRVSDLLRMSTGHQAEPAAHARATMDKDVPGAAGPLQARHAFPLQHIGNLHAVGDGAEGDGDDRARLFDAATVRAAGNRTSDLGNQPTRNFNRRLRIEHPHRRHRQVRAALFAKRKMERQAACAGIVDRRGDGATNF